MSKEGYATTYKELLEETDWSKYGRGKHESCENCMAHCGYEPTAVIQTTSVVQGITPGRVRQLACYEAISALSIDPPRMRYVTVACDSCPSA